MWQRHGAQVSAWEVGCIFCRHFLRQLHTADIPRDSLEHMPACCALETIMTTSKSVGGTLKSGSWLTRLGRRSVEDRVRVYHKLYDLHNAVRHGAVVRSPDDLLQLYETVGTKVARAWSWDEELAHSAEPLLMLMRGPKRAQDGMKEAPPRTRKCDYMDQLVAKGWGFWESNVKLDGPKMQAEWEKMQASELKRRTLLANPELAEAEAELKRLAKKRKEAAKPALVKAAAKYLKKRTHEHAKPLGPPKQQGPQPTWRDEEEGRRVPLVRDQFLGFFLAFSDVLTNMDQPTLI